MQAVTDKAVGAIGNITDTIERISESTGTISDAIDQQRSATQEISRNVGQAAEVSREVAARIQDDLDGVEAAASPIRSLNRFHPLQPDLEPANQSGKDRPNLYVGSEPAQAIGELRTTAAADSLSIRAIG